jgi:hypothetical protein
MIKRPAPRFGVSSAKRPRPGRDPGARQERTNNQMTNRTMTTAVAGRSSSMRRLRRRAAAAQRPYCGTNGCTSYLEIDATSGVAQCPICGYRRRLH